MSQNIAEIPGVSGEVLSLFRAAGFEQTSDLLAKSEGDVLALIAEANERHGLVERMPSEPAVRAWLSAARVLEHMTSRNEKVPLTAETMRQVRESAIMHARPVPGRELVEAGIPVSVVPIAEFVGEVRRARTPGSAPERERGGGRENRRRSERKLRPAEKAEARPGPDGESGDAGKAEHLPEVQGRSKVYHLEAREEVSIEEAMPDFEEVSGGEASPAAGVRSPAVPADEDFLNFRPIDEITMTKKGQERRNSGMTHKNPHRVVVSSLSTVLFALGGGLSGLTVLVMGGYYMAANMRLPEWLLWVLAAAFFCVLQFLFFGTRARCRLCGYRLFVPKACLKHEKAPRSFLGSPFATAVQVLFKHSWRCMFCGTKQKLK